jgi:hypothetical protein
MSWRKNLRIFELLLAFALCGCGVKGDPLPPEKPPELGRGRPTYKGASEEIKIEKRRGKDSDKKDDDDEQ